MPAVSLSRSAARVLLGCFLLLIAIPGSARPQFKGNALAASEELFKQMLQERPEYASSPGKETTLTIQEFYIDKPVRWTMEYGDNPEQDKNTLVYKVRARYTVQARNFNTVTGQEYPPSSREYRRRFNYYVDRRGHWVAQMAGTTSDWT